MCEALPESGGIKIVISHTDKPDKSSLDAKKWKTIRERWKVKSLLLMRQTLPAASIIMVMTEVMSLLMEDR